uniref:Uncharacterized protein n=1 Tax=Piliocolobus tephrosceles TaxID=591936 RepID=A0A8C9IS99_9PRIM
MFVSTQSVPSTLQVSVWEKKTLMRPKPLLLQLFKILKFHTQKGFIL